MHQRADVRWWGEKIQGRHAAQAAERWMDGGGRRWGLRRRMDGVSICELYLMHACRKPLPLIAHGTQRYKAAARHMNVICDVGG